MRRIHIFTFMIFALTAMCLALASCIDDSYTTSPSAQPAFSVDTLDIGLVYTDELTVTSRFTVYNRNNQGINVQSISLSGPDSHLFRANVDGMGGSQWRDVEIRARDSIYVFVDATLPATGTYEPVEVAAQVDFTVNGVTTSVQLRATGQDVERLQGVVIDTDTMLGANRPYQVRDSLVVAPGATLTLAPGTRLLFHDKAYMAVHGTLIADGTAQQPVLITGDRTGEVLPGVSFDIMSRQWEGIDFTPASSGSVMRYTEVSNTSYGVAVYGDGTDLDQKKLTLENCKLRNSGECVLLAFDASVEALGCEFAEAAHSLVYLVGGDHRFDQCTASNNYLFSVISGAAWTFIDPADTEQYASSLPTKALITNTITYGLGLDASPGDLTGTDIVFNRCLFRSDGEDDDNFIDCLWAQDPLFYTVRDEYHFDYRLQPESPAIGTAYPELSERPLDTDFYGEKRDHDLGAYVFTPLK